MKKISRKGFLKLAAAAAMSGVTAGALAACDSSSAAAGASSAAAEGGYTAGTYTATAAGINGDVTVTMTFDATKITEVVVDASGETESIGGAAAEKLAAYEAMQQFVQQRYDEAPIQVQEKVIAENKARMEALNKE